MPRKKNKYDERQMLARGKAFRAAYVVLVAYLLVYGIIYLFGVIWSDGFAGGAIGICLSATVFVVLCIKNDAYASIREKPGRFIVPFSVISLLYLLTGITNLIRGVSFITDGRLNSNVAPFLVGIIYLVALPFMIVKARTEKSDTEAE